MFKFKVRKGSIQNSVIIEVFNVNLNTEKAYGEPVFTIVFIDTTIEDIKNNMDYYENKTIEKYKKSIDKIVEFDFEEEV